MTGNTWDWTSSRYMDYPYNAADGREDPVTPGARRVVRGGSWFVALASRARPPATAAFQALRDDVLGLRVARSSPGLA